MDCDGQSIDKSFADLFTMDGFNIVRNEGRFEAETLRDVRVLVTAAAGGGNTFANGGESCSH